MEGGWDRSCDVDDARARKFSASMYGRKGTAKRIRGSGVKAFVSGKLLQHQDCFYLERLRFFLNLSYLSLDIFLLLYIHSFSRCIYTRSLIVYILVLYLFGVAITCVWLHLPAVILRANYPRHCMPVHLRCVHWGYRS